MRRLRQPSQETRLTGPRLVRDLGAALAPLPESPRRASTLRASPFHPLLLGVVLLPCGPGQVELGLRLRHPLRNEHVLTEIQVREATVLLRRVPPLDETELRQDPVGRFEADRLLPSVPEVPQTSHTGLVEVFVADVAPVEDSDEPVGWDPDLR